MNTYNISKTSNVICIPNVAFSGAHSKTIRIEDIDFSDADVLDCHPAVLYQYFNGAKTASELSWRNSDQWYRGWKCYDKKINIIDKVGDGAKYLYCLGNFISNHEETVIKSRLSSVVPYGVENAQGKIPVTSATISSNPDIIIPGTGSSHVISNIAIDSSIAYHNTFDSHLSEVCIDLEYLVNNGMKYITFGYVGESVEPTTNVNSLYPNTVIDMPIAYFIYNE